MIKTIIASSHLMVRRSTNEPMRFSIAIEKSSGPWCASSVISKRSSCSDIPAVCCSPIIFCPILKDKKNEKKVLELQRAISDADKRLSLGDFCEEALNIGNDEANKKKLFRSVLGLSTEVLKRISQL